MNSANGPFLILHEECVSLGLTSFSCVAGLEQWDATAAKAVQVFIVRSLLNVACCFVCTF
jgi:hypothetical protein